MGVIHKKNALFFALARDKKTFRKTVLICGQYLFSFPYFCTEFQKQLLMEDEFIIYKHYRTINTTAIYVSECGGVMTKSPNKGIRYAKYYTKPCPAMKKRHKYPQINLLSGQSLGGMRNFSVHRLVAEVWLHPKNLFEIEVDHLDGNRMNFHILNLEWVTKEENIRRAVEMRRRKKAEKGGVDK